ncbi:MAG: hypothetical protein FE036_02750 [Thermoplasmata archaeon]|nr:MAG: hypothetical protein FE036_02750 [Thermoplasmata archaeon]
MNKYIWRLTFILIISILCIPIGLGNPYFHSKNTNALDGAWLEIRDGVRIMYLNGSYYDMGYQLGYFLKDDYLKSRRAWLYFIDKKLGITYDDLLHIWKELKDFIPEEYKEEMRGRADAVGLSFEEVAIMDVLDPAIRCVGMACWGPATSDGKLYHARSADFPLNVRDPVTADYASNDQLLIVRTPEKGFASVVIGLSIEVGAEGGLNENGICIGYTSVDTKNITIYGIPLGIRQRMVLDRANNIKDALNIISNNRTSGATNIISDGKERIAYVVEQTANYSYEGTWNGSIENNYPSWVIDHVVRRDNIFLDPVSAGLSDDVYEKSNFFRWVLSFFGLEKNYTYFWVIKHFKIFSDAIEKNYGRLNLNNTMNMLRAVYQGKTNLFYRFVQILGGPYSNVWYQWVICPETGNALVSFARNSISAYYNPVHYFNLYDLINGLPTIKSFHLQWKSPV